MALLVALAFNVANDSGIRLRNAVRLVFVVTQLNHKIVIEIEAGTKVIRRLAPRFLPRLQAIENLADVVFFQTKQVGLAHNSADTPGQVCNRAQALSRFAIARRSGNLQA